MPAKSGRIPYTNPTLLLTPHWAENPVGIWSLGAVAWLPARPCSLERP